VVDWNLFCEAYMGDFIPPGVMETKHTEFMQLTQANKTMKEYLHAFNHLSRYAPEFVSTEANKIASFKRGLGPKLLKTMGHTKSATFNEFVSDALTQENYNTMYTATKTHKRALSPRHLNPRLRWQLSPSIVLQLLICGTVLQQRKIRKRRGSTRGTPLLFLGGILGLAMPRLHLPIIHAGTAIRRGIGKATVLTHRRRATKGMSIMGVFTIL